LPTSDPTTYDSEEARQFFIKLLAEKGFECTPPLTVSRMIDCMVGDLLESQATTRPVFITEHPQVITTRILVSDVLVWDLRFAFASAFAF
jgi:hypothetical protein